MGDKVVARQTVRAAGVPVVPGTNSQKNLSDDELLAAADQIGYPLLIKAAAGGEADISERIHSRSRGSVRDEIILSTNLRQPL